MEKDFDSWNKEKKFVDQKTTNKKLFFHTREVWWCSAGLNIGIESNGKHKNFERPMLIIKKFNSEMVWALPLTTNGKNNKYYYQITHQFITSWVIISQIKTISTKRLLRKMGTITEDDFLTIIQKLKNIIKIESPQ